MDAVAGTPFSSRTEDCAAAGHAEQNPASQRESTNGSMTGWRLSLQETDK